MKIVGKSITAVTLAAGLALLLAQTALALMPPVPQTKPLSFAVQANYIPEAAGKPAAPRARSASLFERVYHRLVPLRRLGQDDAARYAHIFAFQDIAAFDEADGEIAKLRDRRLMGHVLLQRYLHEDYNASYAELADWLAEYADHPRAREVYALAQRKSPKAAAALVAPERKKGVLAQHDFDQPVMPAKMKSQMGPKARDLVRLVDANLSRGRPTVAWRKLKEGRDHFEPAMFDALRADIATSFFYNGKHDRAFELASASAQRSGGSVPMAGWIAGLASWKKGDFKRAAGYFERTAKAERATAWMASAGAYWAARSHIRAEQPQKATKWLKHAAEYPRTFYGIIALKALGRKAGDFNWKLAELTDKHIRALSAIPAGQRAVALVDAERPDLAEQELRRINPGKNRELQEAMIVISSQRGMPALAMRLGSAFKDRSGGHYDAAIYPDAPWQPERGMDVDRALVFALIRQESNFDPSAVNRYSGAQGLMQLMPATARHIVKVSGDGVDSDRLDDPTVNIDLGQKYLSELMAHPQVDKNLFKLAVAYNAGPGKLARWQQAMGAAEKEDPLFFIESIPAAETRIFVERVMTNYWIYREKYGQSSHSLDMVAEGDWPVYIAQDTARSRSFAQAVGLTAQ